MTALAGSPGRGGSDSAPDPGHDAGPFDDFLRRNYRSFVAYLAVCSNGDDRFVDDAVQDALLQIERRWEEGPKFRYQLPGLVRHYMFKSGRHGLLRYKRHDARYTSLDDYIENTEATPSVLDDWREDYSDVVAMLKQLPSSQREALFLHKIVGLNQEQTAEIMGQKPNTVKTLIARGMKALKNKQEESR